MQNKSLKNPRILFALTLVFLLACSKDKKNQSPCGPAAIVNPYPYNNIAVNYNISSAAINGDCLTITFGASGCSGNTWTVELYDSGAVLDTNPVMRMVKLKLMNPELCAAVFSKTVSFDLSGLKVQGSNSVIISLTGFSGQLVYQY